LTTRVHPPGRSRIRRPDTASGRLEGEPPDIDHDLGFERLVFFSDAVFAIAITLLIIEVRLPTLPEHPSDADVTAALRATLPSVFAYVLSFATIGLYWLSHWRRWRYIARVNERLVGLNLVLLGLIAFIPFPTALIGEHGDLVTVVVVYASALAAAGIAGPLTWLYAWRSGLALPSVSPTYARLSAIRGFAVPAVLLGSLLFLPFVGTTGVEFMWLLIAPVQLLMNRFVRSRVTDRSSAAA
jgi:TMEM175 potassium channel family protein